MKPINISTDDIRRAGSIEAAVKASRDAPAPRKATAVAIESDPLAAANKGERAYAAHLERQRQAGEIAHWLFQPFKFVLAFNCGLTPDFLVVHNDRTLEAVDVKGRSSNGYWCEEDAKIKLKVAARTHWWLRWVIVWPAKGGQEWLREEL